MLAARDLVGVKAHHRMSTPDHRVETIVAAILKLPPEQRDARVDAACGTDQELHRQVEALLRARESAERKAAATVVALPTGQTVAIPSAPAGEQAGDRIGRYKLLEELGQGGMGTVWIAEQTEPVHRKVALKVIKLGMDTKQVIARFEAERQALALMDHPNIAKVLDAGATETGRPYFVMERVKGISITDYCDQHNLSADERIGLFVQVCHAIQHAHQKGIIHRDIKPSNILVALQDGVAMPKVIDFGIAKATAGQRLTEMTLHTALAEFIGTPAYMSPEQAEVTTVDIDTRSDIYSLGVLLYELLTGKTPFDARRLVQAGIDGIRRIIREEEPPRPSTRLSTLTDEEQTTAAKCRHTDTPGLFRLVRGDLDWVVMKCLEKDRARRYDTANGLAADLQRHLNNEPVAACPPSNLYRFQKLVRRNKLAFAAASAVAAALLLGLATSTWLLVKERESRRQADAAAQKSRQVARFLKDMLNGVGPSVALGRDTTMLREILDKTAARVSKELAGQPEVEAELRNPIGLVYYDLGEYAKAEAMHRKTLSVRKMLLGNEHPDVAATLGNLAWALRSQGKLAEAETLAREALAMRKKLLGNEHLLVARALGTLAEILGRRGKLAEAETMQREALVMFRKLRGDEHPAVADSLNNLAGELAGQRKLDEAETIYREALAMRKKLLGNKHPLVAGTLHNLAVVLMDQGKLAEAETMLREALAMQKKLLGNEHRDVAATLGTLGSVRMDQGNLAEAETMYREALAMFRKLLGDEHPDVAANLNNLAGVLTNQGKLAEAETMGREALAIFRKLLGNEHRDVAATLNTLAEVLERRGKLAEAETIYREALAMRKKLLGNEHPRVAGDIQSLAAVLAREGKFGDAAAGLAESVKLIPDEHLGWYWLAPLLAETGDREEYRQHCLRMLARFGATTNAPVAERTAKASLLFPTEGPDLAAAVKLADMAVAVGEKAGLCDWQFVKGLGEYRQGNFAGAVEWTTKTLARPSQDDTLGVQAWMVLAMAHHRLNNREEAQDTFRKGKDLADAKLPKPGSGDLGPSWNTVLIAHILLREAQALIEGQASAGGGEAVSPNTNRTDPEP